MKVRSLQSTIAFQQWIEFHLVAGASSERIAVSSNSGVDSGTRNRNKAREDPLAEFYALARTEREEEVRFPFATLDSHSHRVPSPVTAPTGT